MKAHKHAELIKAWADGAKIEFLENGFWYDKLGSDWYENATYRIKPEPKPDIVSYLDVTADDIFYTDEANANLKVSIDRETGKLKSAEVLK